MKIVVASLNPVKLRAVEAAFSGLFADQPVDVVGVEVSSGVAEQPMTDDDTRRGARNRAKNAMGAKPDAEFWVGLEGGIENIGEDLMAFAWMSIRRANGKRGEARTVTLTLPSRIRALIDSGLELGDANDEVFGTTNSKQEGGAFGLLTEGRYTRESVYVEALTLALVPIVNELYRS